MKEWGKKGSGPGEFSEPHTIAIDSRGRLFVGDRENNRIQIFDQDGKFLDEWRQFGRPSGIFITKDDTIYVTDSESGPDTGAHELTGIKKGIRIGSAKDGSVTRVHRGHGIHGARPLAAPKASASMRRATSTAPSCAVRCSPIRSMSVMQTTPPAPLCCQNTTVWVSTNTCCRTVRDEAGHRFRRVGRIEKNRFGSRRQLDRLARRVGGDAVAPADEPIVDLDRGAA